jgi:hypothetical protein
MKTLKTTITPLLGLLLILFMMTVKSYAGVFQMADNGGGSNGTTELWPLGKQIRGNSQSGTGLFVWYSYMDSKLKVEWAYSRNIDGSYNITFKSFNAQERFDIYKTYHSLSQKSVSSTLITVYYKVTIYDYNGNEMTHNCYYDFDPRP